MFPKTDGETLENNIGSFGKSNRKLIVLTLFLYCRFVDYGGLTLKKHVKKMSQITNIIFIMNLFYIK